MGSGWLGLPLAHRFVALDYRVNLSTTSPERLPELAAVASEGHVVKLGTSLNSISPFLQSKTLIINITSKDISGFRDLVRAIESSRIESVLFVSSTSVYPPNNKTVTEDAGNESADHPLVIIENLFRQSKQFKTTIIRFAGLIGGRRHPGRFFAEGKTIKDPDAPVNLIHLDDCLNIISQIVTDNLWGETFNACADTHPKKRDYYAWAAKQAGVPQPKFAQTNNRAFKIVNNRKLKQMLDYKFIHPDLMAINFEEPNT